MCIILTVILDKFIRCSITPLSFGPNRITSFESSRVHNSVPWFTRKFSLNKTKPFSPSIPNIFIQVISHIQFIILTKTIPRDVQTYPSDFYFQCPVKCCSVKSTTCAILGNGNYYGIYRYFQYGDHCACQGEDVNFMGSNFFRNSVFYSQMYIHWPCIIINTKNASHFPYMVCSLCKNV